MLRRLSIAAVAIVVLILVVQVLRYTSLYTIDEREQAVVTRFNKPVRVIVGNISGEGLDTLATSIGEAAGRPIRVAQGAGLYFRMPFVDVVERFPDVLLETDTPPRDVILADKKKLLIDNFARWYIENPLLYRIRVRNEGNARERLDYIIYSAMRQELGRNELTEVVRSTNRFLDYRSEAELSGESQVGSMQNPVHIEIRRGRQDIMDAVTQVADARAREFGIRVLDVRIKRADLLPENLQAVFKRMRAERSRISTGYRSEGQKQVDIIEGDTDRQVQVIIAEAERDAMVLRGEGDAQATRIFAEAFGADPEFYRYIRSLEVVQDATPEGSELILGLDSSLYRILAGESAGGAGH